jgi:hypothetical protein
MMYLLVVSSTVAPSGNATTEKRWTSVNGNFFVRYISTLQPITINRIHHWILYLEDSEGKLVDGAKIVVKGGMPAHNHGLPTSPRVSKTQNKGEYRLEGLRFHMPGYWEITLTIDAGNVSDIVLIPLAL